MTRWPSCPLQKRRFPRASCRAAVAVKSWWKQNVGKTKPEDPLAGADEDVMISESAVNLMPFAFEALGWGRRGRHLTRSQASLLTNNRSHTFRLKVWSEAP